MPGRCASIPALFMFTAAGRGFLSRRSVAALLFVLATVVPAAAAQTETVADIQTRGNVATSDEELRKLAAVEVGMPVEPGTPAAIEQRLRATKRFESVEVLKRYASISDPTKIVIVIIVDEGAVSIKRTGDPNNPVRVVRRRWPNLLLMPILGNESGYGPTYGVRLTHPEPAGRGSRLSFPLTWGATKRAAVEFEKRYPSGWLTRVESGALISRRTNPYFDADEDRESVWFRPERQLTQSLRVRAITAWQHVSFRDVSDRFATIGAEAILDTRLDPFLARNAVFLRAFRGHLAFNERNSMNVTELEAHTYLGLIGQSILVASARKNDSDGPLPDYLKSLLGGPSTIRGFKTGFASGDNLVAGSLELRVPLSSPLSFGKFGLSAFTDAGTTYNEGQRFADQALYKSAGAGVWFTAAILRVELAVAHGIGASTRVHFQGNLTF